jgi:hypothetical protein
MAAGTAETSACQWFDLITRVAYDRPDRRPERFMILLSSPHRICVWVIALAVCLVPLAAGAQKKDDRKQQEAQDREVQTLAKLVDAASAGQPAPADFAIQWHNDFLKAQEGRTYVPFTLTIDPTKLSPQPIAMYIRVLPRAGETAASTTSMWLSRSARRPTRGGTSRRRRRRSSNSPFPFRTTTTASWRRAR